MITRDHQIHRIKRANTVHRSAWDHQIDENWPRIGNFNLNPFYVAQKIYISKTNWTVAVAGVAAAQPSSKQRAHSPARGAADEIAILTWFCAAWPGFGRARMCNPKQRANVRLVFVWQGFMVDTVTAPTFSRDSFLLIFFIDFELFCANHKAMPDTRRCTWKICACGDNGNNGILRISPNFIVWMWLKAWT